MPRTLPLAGLAGCTKPNCTRREPINRHHRAHEALWISALASHRDDQKYWRLVKRYNEFREEDTVRVCLGHHAEIHSIYDLIIEEDRARTGIPLYLYSWTQVRRLSQLLRDACSEWLLMETPGLDSEIYEQTKKMRRALARKRFRKLYPRSPEQRTDVRRRAKALKKGAQRRKRRKRR